VYINTHAHTYTLLIYIYITHAFFFYRGTAVAGTSLYFFFKVLFCLCDWRALIHAQHTCDTSALVARTRPHQNGNSDQEGEEGEDYTYLASWTKSKTQQSNSEQPDVTYLAAWRQSNDGTYRW